MYASHLINGLSSTAIGGKTSLEVWSGEAAKGPGLLREFESPAYFSTKDSMVNPRAKKFVFLGGQKKYEKLQVMGPRK